MHLFFLFENLFIFNFFGKPENLDKNTIFDLISQPYFSVLKVLFWS